MIKRYWPTLIFSALVLLVFALIRHIIWTAHFDFHQISQNEQGKYTFLIVHRGRIEEKEYALKVLHAAKSIGWKGYEVSLTPSGWLKECIKKLPLNPLSHIVRKVQPNFILSMTKDLPVTEKRPTFLLLSPREFDCIEESTASFDPNNWEGILGSSYLLGKLQNLYKENSPFCIPWYWSSFSTQFYTPQARRLIEIGHNKGSFTPFNKLHSLLERSGYLDANIKKQDPTEVIEAIHRSGIALVLHSEYQVGSETPSQHFFDAVAASAVVISDKHPFIQKEFKDSVLYIDQNDSEEDLYQTVDQLIEWVWENQEEAALLAKKAHAIFIEKFTIQNFLLELEKSLLKS
ncbi:MAG: hypothetical protein FJZ56_04505 [Chlamydiae bacterium]|nr:hypothetical protein [Chlamydiota bacterium]